MELTPAQMLTLIAERATELRAVGVRRVELPGLVLELAPGEAAEPSSAAIVPPLELVEDPDPLNDPVTFARRDGSIPGFKRSTDDDT